MFPASRRGWITNMRRIGAKTLCALSLCSSHSQRKKLRLVRKRLPNCGCNSSSSEKPKANLIRRGGAKAGRGQGLLQRATLQSSPDSWRARVLKRGRISASCCRSLITSSRQVFLLLLVGVNTCIRPFVPGTFGETSHGRYKKDCAVPFLLLRASV